VKTIKATSENTKVGRLVIHKFLCDSDDTPRIALVVDEDDGYGDIGVTFQAYPDLTYYFELENLLLVEE
jgi:hypothetical protein